MIPAAVGGSAIHRWADGGDLNKMMVAVIQAAKMRYTITGVLLNQGAADFTLSHAGRPIPVGPQISDRHNPCPGGECAVLHHTEQ